MKKIIYPDNTFYHVVEKGDPDKITWKLNQYSDLWGLAQYVEAYNHVNKKKPLVTIPRLLDDQADRRFGDNESTGLRHVLTFLAGMNASFKIFHPHNREVVEAILPTAKLLNNNNLVKKVLEKEVSFNKDTNPFIENAAILAPDAGAFKWVVEMADSIGWDGDVESASKSRSKKDIGAESGKKRLKQKLPTQDFGGKDIFIVDDRSIYGGTFKGLSDLLKKANCGKLYLIVSHMTVQEIGDKGSSVTEYFDKVYTTNSVYDEYFYTGTTEQPTNLEVIKMF